MSRAGVCAAWIALAVAALPGQQLTTSSVDALRHGNDNKLCLTFTNERAAPGGMAQVKVFVTEPQPISTGRGSIGFDGFETIDGIALGGNDPEAQGVAIVNDGSVEISFDSPVAMLGTTKSYPLLTITGRVSSSASIGASFPVNIDAGSLRFTGASGALDLDKLEGGSITVAPVLSIDDVRPGTGLVPADGIVSILGTGFEPTTQVRLRYASIAGVQFVSPEQIDVTLAAPVSMQGMKIRATNLDLSSQTYFSYQRTTRDGTSQHPVLQRAVPLFSSEPAFTADVDLACGDCGLAVQNQGEVDASVTAELFMPDDTSLGVVTLTVPAFKYIVRGIPELFDLSSAPAVARVRVLADTPVRTMGIAVDAAGHASTLRARQ
jgi:hypothetical protein